MNAKNKSTYTGDQHDEIEKLMDDAEKLLAHPDTRREGRDLMHLAQVRIARERNRITYAGLTNQEPNIPPLEPALKTKAIKEKN